MPDAAAPGLFQAPSLSNVATLVSELSTGPDVHPLPRLAEISRIVNQVAASWNRPSAVVEQRRWQRIPYDRPAILTPLDDQTGQALLFHKIVSGRDISPAGFSFTHIDPLACRRAIVTFAFEQQPWDAIVLRLSWCRFTRAGIYQSGGKFSNSIESPLAPELILDELPYA